MCILLYVKHSSLKSIRSIKEKEVNNTIGIVWKGQTCKGDQGLEIPGALPPQAAAAAAAKSLLSCPTLRPHRRQPTRLPHPWNSPGKNTGVGCHFLLQCMKVKRESKVTQSCPTLSNPMDCSPPGSSVHGIFQARVLEWGAITFSDHPKQEILLLLFVLLPSLEHSLVVLVNECNCNFNSVDLFFSGFRLHTLLKTQ